MSLTPKSLVGEMMLMVNLVLEMFMDKEEKQWKKEEVEITTSNPNPDSVFMESL